MIPLIVAGASLAAQGIAAKVQHDKAVRLQKAAMNRPQLGIPLAMQEKKNLLKSMADSSLLPAQGYYENQMGASVARANREIQNTGGSANDIIAGLTQVDANTRAQTNQLAAQGAENQQNNRQQYGGALSEVANQQNEMFDYNQNQPYQTQQIKIQALKDASNRNLNNMIQSGIDVANNYQMGGQMDKLYGTNMYGMNGVKKIGAKGMRVGNTNAGNITSNGANNTWPYRSGTYQPTNPMFDDSNLGFQKTPMYNSNIYNGNPIG